LSHNKNTQFDLQFSQLVTTAGKYFKQIQINKQNVQLSEFEFFDLMRTLKLAVRQNFYEINRDQQKLEVIKDGMSELDKLIDVTGLQVERGNIARKELIRLQSMMLEFA